MVRFVLLFALAAVITGVLGFTDTLPVVAPLARAWFLLACGGLVVTAAISATKASA